MIDSHAHVSFDSFDADRDEVINRLEASHVTHWIEIGTDLEQSQKAIMLAQQYKNCYATVGVHPSDIGILNEDIWKKLEDLLKQPKVVAIGEVGFDLYRGGSVEEQEIVLKKFAELARKYNKPLVFHVRDQVNTTNAHEAMLAFLKSFSEDNRPRGVLHTFSGNKKQAEEYLNLGQYLSFSGVITFPKAGEIIDVARTMPLDKLLIETDCPFLTPIPYRGKRNEPSYVSFVAQKIAELREISLEEVDQTTEANTKRVFGIPQNNT